jgi:hypothetical protein
MILAAIAALFASFEHPTLHEITFDFDKAPEIIKALQFSEVKGWNPIIVVDDAANYREYVVERGLSYFNVTCRPYYIWREMAARGLTKGMNKKSKFRLL